MSTVAYRAGLIREIEGAMRRINHTDPLDLDRYEDGKLDAYAHILMLVKGEDL